MMPQCVEKDCIAEAAYYPQITVAPYGYPIERGQTMQFGLTFCSKHIGEVAVNDLFDEESKRKFSQAVRDIYKSEVPLDWSRTRIVPRKIGDSLWKLLNKED